MKSAFYAGATGLMAHQEALNTIGHNLANVNTTGYKAQGTSFDELLYNRMYVNTENEANNGFGVRAVSTGILPGQAEFIQTGNPLSFAVSGDAFFAVETGSGQTMYTRDGSFALSVEGDRPYLTTADGCYVLGRDGQRVQLEEKKPLEFPKGEGGNNNTDNKNQGLGMDYEALAGKIGLYRFANPGALQPMSTNRYAATPAAGEAKLEEENGGSKVLSGYLEQSGVSITDEMANMIAAQRSYQLSARVVQVADEVEQVVNGLRR